MPTDGVSYGEILEIRKRPIQFNLDSPIGGRARQNRDVSSAPLHTEGLYDWLSPEQAADFGAGYGVAEVEPLQLCILILAIIHKSTISRNLCSPSWNVHDFDTRTSFTRIQKPLVTP